MTFAAHRGVNDFAETPGLLHLCIEKGVQVSGLTGRAAQAHRRRSNDETGLNQSEPYYPPHLLDPKAPFLLIASSSGRSI